MFEVIFVYCVKNLGQWPVKQHEVNLSAGGPGKSITKVNILHLSFSYRLLFYRFFIIVYALLWLCLSHYYYYYYYYYYYHHHYYLYIHGIETTLTPWATEWVWWNCLTDRVLIIDKLHRGGGGSSGHLSLCCHKGLLYFIIPLLGMSRWFIG